MQQHQPPLTNGAPDDSSGSGTSNPPPNSPPGIPLHTGYYAPPGQHLLPPSSTHFWYPPAPGLGCGLQQPTQSGGQVPLSMGSQPRVNMQQYHYQQQPAQLYTPNAMQGVTQQWRPPLTNGPPDVLSGSHTWNPQPNSPRGIHLHTGYFSPPVSTTPPCEHYPTCTGLFPPSSAHFLYPVPGLGYGLQRPTQFPGQVPPSTEPQPHHEVNMQQPAQLYTPNAMGGVMHAPMQWQPPMTTGATDVFSGSGTPNPRLNGPHGIHLHTGYVGPAVSTPPPHGNCPIFSGLSPHYSNHFLDPPAPGLDYGLQQPTQYPGQVPSSMEPQHHQVSMQQPAQSYVPATPNAMGGEPHAPQDKDMHQQPGCPDNSRSYRRQWKDVPYPVLVKLGKIYAWLI